MTCTLDTTDVWRVARQALGVLCLVLSICLPVKAFSGDVLVMVGEPEGWPVVTIGGGRAMTSRFAFWGAQWQWDSLKSEFKNIAPLEYTVSSQGTLLGLNIKNQIARTNQNQLRWAIEINATKSSADAQGGGVVFNFDLNVYKQVLGEPELLPGNRGWSWGKRGAKSYIEMRFEPALAAVYFEQNRTNEIRAFFYSQSVPAGSRKYIATLTVAGDVAINPTQSERFGENDVGTWIRQKIDWESSPVDLSSLNRLEIPAGKHGFVQAEGEKLVFHDGTSARFWGTNVAAYTLFHTAKEEVRQQAKRLSRLGFNLVRLHHHDSPWVEPNIFGGRQAFHGNTLDPAMLERLDWWIKCLKDEGIYVWLDMHAQRFLNKSDSITAFDEISKGKENADLKGYNYVNPSVALAMKNFSSAYLRHINQYTGLAYKDDAAIVAVLITNENDLTSHFGNALLPDKKVPWHNSQYMREAKAYATKSGLNPERTWRSWEPGAAIYFLNDLEYRFDVDMIAYLRGLGVRVPIVTTNTWGNNPLNSLPALTTGDMIDVHSYGGVGELEMNPLYSANMVNWLGAAQVSGRPMTVSEWNVSPYPVADRHNVPIYIAAVASHQGWDAIMQYAYSQEPIRGAGTPSNWHAYNDPALLAALPAAALMYRQGHVREATTTYTFVPNKNQLFDQAISPTNSVALRTAMEIGKLTISMPQILELPWLKQSIPSVRANVITDPKRSILPDGSVEAISDTGELKRNWVDGIYTIDTPYTQAAMGWIGGRQLKLSDVEIIAENKNATVAVQTLDNRPIRTSKWIFISVTAGTRIAQDDPSYFYAEPISTVIRIAATKGLKLVTAGDGVNTLPVSYNGGYYQMDLKGAATSYFLTSVVRAAPPKVVPSTVVSKAQPVLSSGGDNPYKLNLKGAESDYRLRQIEKRVVGQ